MKRLWWDFWVNFIAKSNLIPTVLRFYIYKMAGLVKTSGVHIRSGCTFRGKNVVIGEGSFLNYNVYLDCIEKIVIGKNVSIAFDVLLCTSSHEIGSQGKRAGKSKRAPIYIGDGCWIGARATVLPGVNIGEGCIVAAGSVVNKDCASNGLYAGVPAKRIKDLY